MTHVKDVPIQDQTSHLSLENHKDCLKQTLINFSILKMKTEMDVWINEPRENWEVILFKFFWLQQKSNLFCWRVTYQAKHIKSVCFQGREK